jgi:hypothetical protein
MGVVVRSGQRKAAPVCHCESRMPRGGMIEGMTCHEQEPRIGDVVKA